MIGYRNEGSSMIHQTGVVAHVKTSAGFDDQVPVILEYNGDDPYAVSITFDVDLGPTWIVARDLFALAVDSEGVQGEGDVQVLDEGDTVLIFLATEVSKHAHTAAVKILKVEVIEFLDETYEIVKRGDESSKIDAELDAYLADLLAIEGE